jgi:hypothetical protein
VQVSEELQVGNLRYSRLGGPRYAGGLGAKGDLVGEVAQVPAVLAGGGIVDVIEGRLAEGGDFLFAKGRIVGFWAVGVVGGLWRAARRQIVCFRARGAIKRWDYSRWR